MTQVLPLIEIAGYHLQHTKPASLIDYTATDDSGKQSKLTCGKRTCQGRIFLGWTNVGGVVECMGDHPHIDVLGMQNLPSVGLVSQLRACHISVQIPPTLPAAA